MVGVKNRECITRCCCNRSSFGVAGTRIAEYCAQHISYRMVNVNNRNYRNENCGKNLNHLKLQVRILWSTVLSTHRTG